MPLLPFQIRLEEAHEIVTRPEAHAHRATARVLAWAALRAARGLPTNTARLYRMQPAARPARIVP
jgi:hypothetical protein